MREAATRTFGIGARRSALIAGATAAVLAGTTTAYACTGDGTTAHVTTFTPAQVAAIKAELTSDLTALREAKALELAAMRAHDRAAAIAAAQKAAAAKAALRKDIEAAIAEARAEAKTRAAARARNAAARREAAGRVEATLFHRNDPYRHHCDGDHDGWRNHR